MLKSPHEYRSLDAIAALGGEDRVGVLLFQDAVMFPLCSDMKDELLEVADEVYVMSEDLEARGFKGRVGPEFREVGYPEAVDLIMDEYDLTITV
jgi:sulfur relay protein TusB/DsrH